MKARPTPRRPAPRRNGAVTAGTIARRMRKSAPIVPILCVFLCVGLWIGRPAAVFAYRPFDSTDAAVADQGALEVELGPVGFVKTGPDRFLVAPTAIFNVGVLRDCELVLEGRNFILLDAAPGETRLRLVDTGLSLKTVLRDGTLQGGTGLSVATEIGALLPTVNDEPGVGGIATVIVSHASRPLTFHLNGAVAISRAHNADLFGGLIVEGPQAWPFVRSPRPSSSTNSVSPRWCRAWWARSGAPGRRCRSTWRCAWRERSARTASSSGPASPGTRRCGGRDATTRAQDPAAR